MEFDESHHGPFAIVAPKNRIDEATATEFQKLLIDRAGKHQGIVLDLKDVSFMTSRGLRGLMMAQKVARPLGHRIVVASPNEEMRAVLAISKYDMIFSVHADAKAAIEALENE
ncbi:MAG: STAS domain-containing protein [Erythrobacter sp.]